MSHRQGERRRITSFVLRCGTLVSILGTATAIALFDPVHLQAERLPLQIYNASNGLAHDRIRCVMADSRGFLWFCTADGLSRFDGSRFVNYGREHGLPHPEVEDIVEAGPGVYWVGTQAGLARLRAGSNASSGVETLPLKVYSLGADAPANHVFGLKMDRDGRMWIGTAGGLFVLDRPLDEPRFRRVEPDRSIMPFGEVRAFAEGPDRTLWIGTLSGLFHRLPDGRIMRDDAVPAAEQIHHLLVDRAGRIWAGVGIELRLVVRTAHSASPAMASPALPGAVRNLRETSDGHVWIATSSGLIEFDGEEFRAYSERHGLPNETINAIAEDRAGNVWIGTDAGGAVRLIRNGSVSFRESDGLRHNYVTWISQSRTGRLRAGGGWPVVNEFDGERFAASRFRIPGEVNLERVYDVLQDRRGDLWVGTPIGLLRFPDPVDLSRLPRVRPKAIYSIADGLPVARVAPSFEDSRGDVWMTAYVGSERRVVQWQRSTGRFHQFPDTDSPLVSLRGPAFAEDSTGTVWLGSSRGLARYRDGRFTNVAIKDENVAIPVTTVHVDPRGRLWVGTRGAGLFRSDDPLGERPGFTGYTAAHGLSSSTIWCLTDDGDNVYAGTARGVDRLDPASGHFKRFSVADGLAGSEVITAFRDREGALWFGTFTGISRLTARPRAAHGPPTVWIGGLRIGGLPQPLDLLGQAQVSMGRLAPRQNQVQIDYFGLSPASGEVLTYQYQLDGTQSAWSAPTLERTVNFAELSPGSYRFLVRAVNADGHASGMPASVTFAILPPVWKRAWFLATLGLLALASGYALHKYRVARLFEMERLRTRIASDLHDDVGSSLTQISMLSEIVRTRLANPGAQIADSLSRIGTLSRESVDSMSDIVWAIDPVRDLPAHLLQRMRRVANEILGSGGIQLHFTASGDASPHLNADVRHNVFLIFKEILHNIVRHADAATVSVGVTVTSRHLHLTVTDDGRGFEPALAADGQGLRSMRRRASSLGGSLDVASSPGAGTRVAFTLPVR